MTSKNNSAVFTICSWNYCGYARTLAESFLKYNPNIPFYLFIADRPQPDIDVSNFSAKIIVVDQEIAPNYDRMTSIYGVMEYNTSVKPHCFDYLFDELKYDSVCYLDPDIFVTAPLGEVFRLINFEADCVLTPHITAPLDDGFNPDDLAISRSGIYNLGFVAFRNAKPARRFLTWWRNWLETDCVVDLERGVFVDQKFCDFAPAFIEKTHILHDPGYNVAYWNLLHRPVKLRGGEPHVKGVPVKFFHFSGVNKNKPNEFSKHQDRFTRDTIGDLQPIFDRYVSLLLENDHYGRDGLFSEIKYGFGKLDCGAPIIDGMRRCFRRYGEEIPNGQSPLSVDHRFFQKPTDLIPDHGGEPLSRLLAEIYLSRIDLRRAFDAWTVSGRASLKQWAMLSVPNEYGVPYVWVECAGPEPITPPNEASSAPEAFAPSAATAPGSEKATPSAEAAALPIAERGPTTIVTTGRTVLRNGEKSVRKLRKIVSSKIRSAMMKPVGAPANRGLAIYGFFNAETGVGESARALATAFRLTGMPMSCHAVKVPHCEDSVEFATAPSCQNNLETALLVLNADNIANGNLLPPDVTRSNYRIGHFAWELPVFPAIWSRAIAAVDEIWAPSEFVATSLKTATNKTVRVMPHPIPLNNLKREESRAALGLPPDRLIYLVTFDFNSFPERKNPLGAVRAFIDAFPEATDSSPILIVKCHGLYNRDKYAVKLEQMIAGNKNCLMIDRVMTLQEMRQLQSAVDVYLSLHRSEGFGLNLAECMAAGKVVIGTGFSGNIDFMNDENSLLIDYKMREVKAGEYVAWQGQWWADPCHEAAVEALRSVAGDENLRLRLGAAARRSILDSLAYEEIGAKMGAYVCSISKMQRLPTAI